MALRRLFVLGSFLLVMLGAAAPALAQEADPVEAATGDHPFLAGVTIVVTAAIVGAMIGLVYWDRAEMWKTQRAALASGASTTLTETEFMARGLGRSAGLAVSGGTANLNVGETSPEFAATYELQAVEVTWSIAQGADSAELQPAAGLARTATLKGKTPGAVRLHAAYATKDANDQDITEEAEVLVAVHPKPAGGRMLSLSALGKGLGLFTLSMTALGFGVAAAITGQLTTELATFLGTAFGVGAGGAAVAGATGKETGDQGAEGEGG